MKTAFIILGIIIVCLAGLYVYYGGLYAIRIRSGKVGGETIVYKKITGDYKQTASATNEVYDYLLHHLKIRTYKGIGIFYDNPKQVKREELRSEAGCIIEPNDVEKLDAMDCNYEIKQLPYRESAVTEFPYKGNLSLFIALCRVYPELEKYANIHRLPDNPVIEIYDVPGKKIIYRK